MGEVSPGEPFSGRDQHRRSREGARPFPDRSGRPRQPCRRHARTLGAEEEPGRFQRADAGLRRQPGSSGRDLPLSAGAWCRVPPVYRVRRIRPGGAAAAVRARAGKVGGVPLPDLRRVVSRRYRDGVDPALRFDRVAAGDRDPDRLPDGGELLQLSGGGARRKRLSVRFPRPSRTPARKCPGERVRSIALAPGIPAVGRDQGSPFGEVFPLPLASALHGRLSEEPDRGGQRTL